MCGINGIYSTINCTKYQSSIKRMNYVIRHRGPDDQGIWINETKNCILGHQRLSIIGLGKQGSQPMHSNNNRYTITFNGEIYNYKEIFKELKLFKKDNFSGSDTEIILQAINHWGIKDSLKKFIGMFALAIWDNLKQKLFLARDRLGKKPLYYIKNNNEIWFSSEIKTFKDNPNLSLSENHQAIYHYLTLSYVPSHTTIYKEVREVIPGSIMEIDKNLNIKNSKYWNFTNSTNNNIPNRDIIDSAEQLISNSVKVRMRADVPVGIFLSGGIDSGLITAFASRETSKKIQTFTVKSSDPNFDESKLAKKVSDLYSTEHYELNINPDLRNLIPKIALSLDEPFADASIIPSFAISEEASKHVKVVLNGEGSDELFGGYRRHQGFKFLIDFEKYFNFIPKNFWSKIHGILPKPIGHRTKYSFFYRLLKGFNANTYLRYILFSSDGFNEYEKNKYLKISSETSTQDYLKKKFVDYDSDDPLSVFFGLDILFGLSNGLLFKIDMTTMAHSLEARSPFLDHRIIDWITSIKSRNILYGKKTKPILRNLAKKYLPKEIVTAPKRGFEVPLTNWINGPLHEMVNDNCLKTNGIIRQYFDQNFITDLIEFKLPIDNDRRSKLLWTLLMLSLWKETT